MRFLPGTLMQNLYLDRVPVPRPSNAVSGTVPSIFTRVKNGRKSQRKKYLKLKNSSINNGKTVERISTFSNLIQEQQGKGVRKEKTATTKKSGG